MLQAYLAHTTPSSLPLSLLATSTRLCLLSLPARVRAAQGLAGLALLGGAEV